MVTFLDDNECDSWSVILLKFDASLTDSEEFVIQHLIHHFDVEGKYINTFMKNSKNIYNVQKQPSRQIDHLHKDAKLKQEKKKKGRT